MQFISAGGATIPGLGFGTYGMGRPDMLRAIPAALKAGFRHIDTAQIYRNEAEVGECVAMSGLRRHEISFIPGNHTAPEPPEHGA